jgi:hypothetical protein
MGPSILGLGLGLAVSILALSVLQCSVCALPEGQGWQGNGATMLRNVSKTTKWLDLDVSEYVGGLLPVRRSVYTSAPVSSKSFVVLFAAETTFSTKQVYTIRTMKRLFDGEKHEADFTLLVMVGTGRTSAAIEPVLEQLLLADGMRILYVDMGSMHAAVRPGTKYKCIVQYLKFWMFSMDEYEKIVFMDYDIMPTSNMDHYFEQPFNLMFQAHGSPTNGGFMIVKPERDTFAKAMEMIAKTLRVGMYCGVFEKLRPQEDPFDSKLGWGRPMSDVRWPISQSPYLTVHEWKFVASSYDQGLFTYLCFFYWEHCAVAMYNAKFDNIKLGINSWVCGKRDLILFHNAQAMSVPDAEELGVARTFNIRFDHFSGGPGNKPWGYCITEYLPNTAKMFGCANREDHFIGFCKKWKAVEAEHKQYRDLYLEGMNEGTLMPRWMDKVRLHPKTESGLVPKMRVMELQRAQARAQAQEVSDFR